MSGKNNQNNPGSNNPSLQAKALANRASAGKGANQTNNNKAVNSVTFNKQMFLLDYYSENASSALFSQKMGSPLVQQISENLINSFLEHQGAALTFIDNVSPEEKAQLVPSVRMFLVGQGGSQTEVALCSPTEIERGINSPHFYSGASAGLKSLDMKVDGGTNPVTGKIYNIEMSFVFDSINTFFLPCTGVPGDAGPSWAEVLRSNPTSDGSGAYQLKVAISWTSANPNIMSTYDLNNQNYVGYLQFIKSDLSIDENLKTIVKCTFQTKQEFVWGDVTLFDIFDLDYEKKRKELDKNLKAQKGDRHKAAETKKKEIDAQIEKSQAALKRALGNYAAEEAKKQLLERHSKAIEAWEDGGEKGPKPARPDINSQTHTDHINQLSTRMYATYEAGAIGQNKNFTAFGGMMGEDSGNKWAVQATKVSKEISANLQKKHDVDLNLKVDDEADASFLQTEMDVYRTNRINTVLQKAIFNQKMFCKLKLNSAEVQQYIDRMREGKDVAPQTVRDLFNPNTSNNPKTIIECDSGGGMPSSHSETDAKAKAESSKHASKLSAQQRRVMALKKMALRNKAIYAQKVADAQAKGKATSTNDYAGAFSGNNVNAQGIGGVWKNAGIIGGGEAAEESTKEKVKAINEAAGKEEKNINKKLKDAQAIRDQIANQLPVLGGLKELEEELKNFQYIEVVTIGDLLGALMNWILNGDGTGGKTAGQKERINQTRIFLTTIELQAAWGAQKKVRDLYNIPIAVNELQRWFVNNVVATQRTTLTIQELFQGLLDIIQKAQLKKIQLSLDPSQQSSVKYVTKFAPYAMEERGGLKISKKVNDSSNVLTGIIFYVTNQIFKDAFDGKVASHRAQGIPHFFFGGQGTGALMKIDISEKVIAKFKEALIMDARNSEKKANADGTPSAQKRAFLPAMFQCTLTLLGTPYFHLGTLFYLDTASISSIAPWFHLGGYYRITSLEHSFSANGQYTTKISGPLQMSSAMLEKNKGPAGAPNKGGVKVVKAGDVAEVEKNTKKVDTADSGIAPPVPKALPDAAKTAATKKSK